MDPRQQRIQDLNESLKEDYDLLRKLEKAYRLEDDPRRREKYKSDIEPTFRSFSRTEYRFFHRAVPKELRSTAAPTPNAARW